MADLGAVQRAAAGGPPQEAGLPPQAPAGDPGIEAVGQDLTAVKGLIDAQIQAGNPAAEPAMQALQALVQSMAALAGGGEAPAAPGGPVPLEQQGVPL